jgi:transposase-like protein
MPRGYDDAKRAAVLAALLAGQSIHQVAREFQISRKTVLDWRRAAGMERTRVEPQKVDELGELISDVLRANLRAVQVLAEHVATEVEWRRKQPASDLAVLSGVLTDKAVRILEAFEAAQPTPEVDATTASDTEDE